MAVLQLGCDEFRQQEPNRFPGPAEREIARRNNRTGQIKIGIDRQRFNEALIQKGLPVRHRQQRMRDAGLDGQKLARKRIRFRYNVRDQPVRREGAIDQ